MKSYFHSRIPIVGLWLTPIKWTECLLTLFPFRLRLERFLQVQRSENWILDIKFIFGHFYLIVPVKYKETNKNNLVPILELFHHWIFVNNHLLLVPDAALPFDAVLLIEVLLRLKHWICKILVCERLNHIMVVETSPGGHWEYRACLRHLVGFPTLRFCQSEVEIGARPNTKLQTQKKTNPK